MNVSNKSVTELTANLNVDLTRFRFKGISYAKYIGLIFRTTEQILEREHSVFLDDSLQVTKFTEYADPLFEELGSDSNRNKNVNQGVSSLVKFQPHTV